MGCCSSSAVEIERDAVILQTLNKSDSITTFKGLELGTFNGAFNLLTSTVHEISFGSFNAAALSMNENSMPIVFAEYFHPKYFSIVKYPLLSINCTPISRIAAFSSLDVLQPENFNQKQTKNLLANIVRFLQGKMESKETLIISENSELFTSKFQQMNLKATVGDFTSDFAPYSVIILSTTTNLNPQNIDALKTFISRGGGVGVFFNGNMNINDFLIEYGLAFQPITHISENGSYNFKILPTIGEGRNSNFITMANKLQNMIQQSQTNLLVDDNDFDDLSSQVRLHLNQARDYDYLIQFKSKLLNYIQQNDTDNGEKQLLKVKICKLLVEDICYILPHNSKESLIVSNEETPELINTTLTLQLKENQWTPTGLYLPPNVEATFDSQKKVIVQVGAQTDTLLHTDRWDRYPYVAKRFLKGETLFSLHGGLIFLVGYPNSSGPITVSFNNVASIDNSPWKIFEMDSFTFILSAEIYKQISTDTISISKQFNEIGKEIQSVFQKSLSIQPLIVFDSGNGSEYEDIYPITITKEYEQKIMKPSECSKEILYFIQRICNLYIPELCFNADLEQSICQCFATIIAQRIYKDSYNEIFSHTENHLTNLFMNYINQYKPETFIQAVQNSLKGHVDPRSSLNILVNELCTACGTNIRQQFKEFILFS